MSALWGIQPVGNPEARIAWSHWSLMDAVKAAAYNSERRGPWEVVEVEGRDLQPRGTEVP